MIVRDDYAVFTTKHSDGDDVCIIDSCGRFVLIHKDDLDTLRHDLLSLAYNTMQDLDRVRSGLGVLFPDD